jgi:diketogulonate reductase-like aldo/keto reductase
MTLSRRDYIRRMAALAALPFLKFDVLHHTQMAFRQIPSTGELLPLIGLGTWQTFDVGDRAEERKVLSNVLKLLSSNNHSLIDSSPMYGSSEEVVGDLSSQLNLNDKFFLATKVWTSGKEAGIAQMKASMKLLRRKQLDLIQIHNLVDWQTHLNTLRDWKEQEKIRYIGITHYLDSAHASVERLMKTEPLDFIQINYSMMSRSAEQRLLPLAQEKKIAVLINRPFEEGVLFQRVKGKPLPEWAKEFDCESWGQFFLKYILAHPAVNCVIPGTSKPHHMVDNLKAGEGLLPDEKQRQLMVKTIG